MLIMTRCIDVDNEIIVYIELVSVWEQWDNRKDRTWWKTAFVFQEKICCNKTANNTYKNKKLMWNLNCDYFILFHFKLILYQQNEQTQLTDVNIVCSSTKGKEVKRVCFWQLH